MIHHAGLLDYLASAWLVLIMLWVIHSDLAQFTIPDMTTALLLASGLGYSAIVAGGWPASAVVGAVVGFGVFASLGEVCCRRTGQDGLGLGNAKLLGGCEAWLGWQALAGVVALAALAALSALAYALVFRCTKLAFGPWLVASFMLYRSARLSP